MAKDKEPKEIISRTAAIKGEAMNHKQTVLRRFPDAKCVWLHNARTYDVSADSYKGKGRFGYGELGWGKEPSLAWKNAADFVNEMPQPSKEGK